MKKANKVVVITGDTSGFGFETMKLFVANGHKVYGISKSEFSYPGEQHLIADISKAEECNKAVKAIFEDAGRIDVLINNAGVGISGAAETTTIELAHKIMNINFFGAFNMAKAVLPIMRAQNSGRIINISSIASAVALPYQAFYSASKSAMDTLFNAIREEVFAFNIKITSVMPGDAKTNFTKNRKNLELDENNPYYESYKRSLHRMESDEQQGFSPVAVAKVVFKVAHAKRPPFNRAVGAKDRCLFFLFRILPKRLRAAIIRKIYT